MKSVEERINGLINYYKRFLETDSFAEVKDTVNTFGKRTRNKVELLIEEAHNHGILLGLNEASNILQTQEEAVSQNGKR